MPAPQVNEPEPPPGSRIDIFGGYTYLRPSGTVGTWSFPSNNTRGYIASGAYYFHNSGFGVQAVGKHLSESFDIEHLFIDIPNPV